MTPEQLFSITSAVALLSWLLLVLLPGRAWVTRSVAGFAVPALFATVYVALIATQWGSSQGGFSTLAAVAQLFANPWLLLAGWIHYLCFDLLIGCWEVRDARDRGLPHLLVVPCLLLTFMFGPAGWLLYQGISATYSRRRPITQGAAVVAPRK
ncbi:MAG TPA: ABA4-like family protein [Candidatus Limnocylindria bacterium]|nr:ABA4-like family protein [Candidatus Limnocylindria bacterium]